MIKKETRRCVHKTSWKEHKVGQKKAVEREDREQEKYGRMWWDECQKREIKIFKGDMRMDGVKGMWDMEIEKDRKWWEIQGNC